MASRYNFSVERKSAITGLMETYQVIECNSFDEARNEVNKAIRDQQLAEEKFLEPKLVNAKLPDLPSLPAKEDLGPGGPAPAVGTPGSNGIPGTTRIAPSEQQTNTVPSGNKTA